MLKLILFLSTTLIAFATSAHAADKHYGDKLCEQMPGVTLPIVDNRRIGVEKGETIWIYTMQVDNHFVGQLMHRGQNDDGQWIPIVDLDTKNTDMDISIASWVKGRTKSNFVIDGYNKRGISNNPWDFQWGIKVTNAFGSVRTHDRYYASCLANQVVTENEKKVLHWELEIVWIGAGNP